MELVDRAVYFIPANAADAAIRRLRAIDVAARGWRDKIRVAWLLEGDSPVVPALPDLVDLASRDFKIHETPPKLPLGRSMANGLERLVHDLRGVAWAWPSAAGPPEAWRTSASSRPSSVTASSST